MNKNFLNYFPDIQGSVPDDTPTCLNSGLDQSPDGDCLNLETLRFFTDDTPTCKY